MKIYVLTGRFCSGKTEEKKPEMAISFGEKGRDGRERSLVEGEGVTKPVFTI